MQNWTCDPAKKTYTYLGWLVNSTDAATGKHAGYSLTVPGPTGNHVSRRCCPEGGGAAAGGGCRGSSRQWVPGLRGDCMLRCQLQVPLLVATDVANATVTGTAINVREAGSVDMPRWAQLPRTLQLD